MSQIIRVGAIACQAKVTTPKENMAVAAGWIAEAARSGVDLLLFPELSLTGYSTDSTSVAALAKSAPVLGTLRSLADQYKMTISAGLVWQDQPGGPKYIAQGLWLPGGQEYIYRKTHLGQRERGEYAAGDCLSVYDLPSIRVGIQLCLEQHFPDISQTLVLKGAQLILCPHATPFLAPDDRRESWHISLRARAYDNCVFILAANQVGDNGQGTRYHGGLLLVNPRGQILAEDFSGKPAMITAAIDLSEAVNVRTTPKGMCRRFYATERRPELYK